MFSMVISNIHTSNNILQMINQMLRRQDQSNVPTSSAYCSLLLDIGISHCTPIILILGDSHSAPDSHLAEVITAPCITV